MTNFNVYMEIVPNPLPGCFKYQAHIVRVTDTNNKDDYIAMNQLEKFYGPGWMNANLGNDWQYLVEGVKLYVKKALGVYPEVIIKD